MDDALLSQITRLSNAEASRTLAIRYASALDTVDIAALSEMFTEDAVLDVPGQRYAGKAAVVQFYSDAFAASDVNKRHFMCNLDVSSTGPGTTRMTSYFLYTFAGSQTSIIGWGQYVDEIVIDHDVTRFSYKSISIDIQTDVREGWATA